MKVIISMIKIAEIKEKENHFYPLAKLMVMLFWVVAYRSKLPP